MQSTPMLHLTWEPPRSPHSEMEDLGQREGESPGRPLRCMHASIACSDDLVMTQIHHTKSERNCHTAAKDMQVFMVERITDCTKVYG